jgi:Family of unknown function (DUF5329)
MLLRRWFLLGALMCAAQRAIAVASATEMARIERLIKFVESRQDMQFIRNGTSYSCADAAKFMRGKFEMMGDQVNTAQQFIDQIASKSSTTGQPYLIRYADGKTVPAALFLGDELKRMDRAP